MMQYRCKIALICMRKKDKTTIINNGKVVGFDEKERMNKNNEQD